jgi:hypothetical protein
MTDGEDDAVEWRLLGIGVHVLVRGGRYLGRIWGVRGYPPFTAQAEGKTLGTEFTNIDAARAAVEAALGVRPG